MALGSGEAVARALGTSLRLAAPAHASSFGRIESGVDCGRASLFREPESTPTVTARNCLVFVFLGALGASACGRPATISDCEEIVARIAELELRSAPASDPSSIAKEVRDTQEAFQAKAKQECVGKRITDRALKCVRNAKTAEEIVHECLN